MNAVQSRLLDTRASAVLRRKHLNITDSRKKILSLFLNHKDALAHADIEKNAGEKFAFFSLRRKVIKVVLASSPVK